MHGHLCVVWWLFSSPVSLFLSFLLLFFQTFQTPFSAVHKKFMSKNPRDFRLGTVVSNDHERNWVQKLFDKQKITNKPNQTLIQFIERGDPVVTEPTSRSSAQEIDTRFSLDCKNTNLFVELLEKDKDRDKDVDADRDNGETRCEWTTNRFVHTARRGRHRFSGCWIAICSCEASRKFSCS